MNFLVKWEGRSSVMIDAPGATEKEARENAIVIATKWSESESEEEDHVPTSVHRVSGLIVEVIDEEGEDITLDPLEPFAQIIADVEDAEATDAEKVQAPSCGDENLDANDNKVACVLNAAHIGKHRSAGGLVWT